MEESRRASGKTRRSRGDEVDEDDDDDEGDEEEERARRRRCVISTIATEADAWRSARGDVTGPGDDRDEQDGDDDDDDGGDDDDDDGNDVDGGCGATRSRVNKLRRGNLADSAAPRAAEVVTCEVEVRREEAMRSEPHGGAHLSALSLETGYGSASSMGDLHSGGDSPGETTGEIRGGDARVAVAERRAERGDLTASAGHWHSVELADSDGDDADADDDDDDDGDGGDGGGGECGWAPHGWESAPHHLPEPLVFAPCRVCLVPAVCDPLGCCAEPVCGECMRAYCTTQVQQGRARVRCPTPECAGALGERVVLTHLSAEHATRLCYLLALGRGGSRTRPCPGCGHLLTPNGGPSPPPAAAPSEEAGEGGAPPPAPPPPPAPRGKSTKRASKKRKERQPTKVQCPKCHVLWCFACHAPWHEGVSCKDYRGGDKLLQRWAGQVNVQGQRNAQKCPRCKVHIQKTEGCNHMICSQCETNFCYRCGERYRELRFFGDHNTKHSVFGCRYIYYPERPNLRRLVRGALCGAKLCATPLLLVAIVIFGILALLVGIFAGPIYLLCKSRRQTPVEMYV